MAAEIGEGGRQRIAAIIEFSPGEVAGVVDEGELLDAVLGQERLRGIRVIGVLSDVGVPADDAGALNPLAPPCRLCEATFPRTRSSAG